MSDGAEQGITAGDSLRMVLGGEKPMLLEQETVEEMSASLLGMTGDPKTYDGTARYCAKLVLEWLMEDPARALTPSETAYAHDDQGQTDGVARRGRNSGLV